MSLAIARFPQLLKTADAEDRVGLMTAVLTKALDAANGYWDLLDQKEKGVPPKDRRPFRNSEDAVDKLYNQLLILLSMIPGLEEDLDPDILERIKLLHARHEAGIAE
jgi:hypothetical protein